MSTSNKLAGLLVGGAIAGGMVYILHKYLESTPQSRYQRLLDDLFDGRCGNCKCDNCKCDDCSPFEGFNHLNAKQPDFDMSSGFGGEKEDTQHADKTFGDAKAYQGKHEKKSNDRVDHFISTVRSILDSIEEERNK